MFDNEHIYLLVYVRACSVRSIVNQCIVVLLYISNQMLSSSY